MQRLFTVLIILSGIILVAAGLYVVILGPVDKLSAIKIAAIPPGDQEVAWLHPATNFATWERFVVGLKELPDVVVDESAAFPEDSMKLPVVGLSKPGYSGTLWIRWYKLTGLRTIEKWVSELCQRQPRPLAVVGGGNSERARDIALQLARQKLVDRQLLPVFLITTATAEKVQHPELGIVDLMQIYPQRSFRYCFTNRQMAEAIHHFVREQISQDTELQITSSRISLISWKDDPFSHDLVEQFEASWRIPSEQVPQPQVASYAIAHSVGALNQPNKLEMATVEKLVREVSGESVAVRGRELLVLPAGPAPARRFLRSLYHTDPNERFLWVVTVGDAIDWNTLYRDRRLTWPVVDVPFPLIAFMHRNPVEMQLKLGRGFVADDSTEHTPNPSGTDDLLLYRDIGHSLVTACFRNQQLASQPDILRQSLRAEVNEYQQPLFDEDGNRPDMAGEYITLLRPVHEELRIAPLSRIEVYERKSQAKSWQRIIQLQATYSNDRLVRGKP